MRSIYSSNDAQLMEAVTATIDEFIIQDNIFWDNPIKFFTNVI
jgi:hypothetical protein